MANTNRRTNSLCTNTVAIQKIIELEAIFFYVCLSILESNHNLKCSLFIEQSVYYYQYINLQKYTITYTCVGSTGTHWKPFMNQSKWNEMKWNYAHIFYLWAQKSVKIIGKMNREREKLEFFSSKTTVKWFGLILFDCCFSFDFFSILNLTASSNFR